MLNIIRNLLSKAIEDIDTGNSNITEEDERKIIGVLTDVKQTGFKELFWRKSDIVKYLAVHN